MMVRYISIKPPISSYISIEEDEMINVLIADDHNLVREGLRALLEKSSDIKVVGEASTGLEAVEKVSSLKPDVVVMDLSMPRLDGLQATERIRDLGLGTAVVIVSMHSDTTMVRQLVQNGAKGYLLKDALSEELVMAVRSASRGRLFLSPTISESVTDLLMSPQSDSGATISGDLLTSREKEVLQLISEGHTNAAIAQILSISVKTVEKHRSNLMSKLQVNDLASLMRVAIGQGLILPS
jgi:DNA-binding NarL/FixJ family response regulator